MSKGDTISPSCRQINQPSEKASRVRIVFFATQLYALATGRSSGFGGAETELWNIANGLADAGEFDVRILTLTDEIDNPRRFSSIDLYPIAPPAPLKRTDPWIKRRPAVIKYYGGLYQALRKQQADIYFTKLASPEASMAWLAARRAGGKYVFRIEHDWETNQSDLIDHIFHGSATSAGLFLRCLRRADLVVVQTIHQKDELYKNFGIDSVLIPNGHAIPSAVSIEHDVNKRNTILWVGRAHPMKRPQLFLDLASQFSDFQFTLVMAPSNEYPELFQQVKQRSEVLPNVTFIPGVSSSEVNNLYQRARLLILTSEAEGFSNVLIEAMKFGSPVLSLEHNPNDVLTVPADASDLQPSHGFCTNDSMEMATAVIAKVTSDQQFWIACHETLTPFVTENFGLEHVLNQYRQQFQRLGDAP